jgi:tetratricopeptide (TPR) repeat protein
MEMSNNSEQRSQESQTIPGEHLPNRADFPGQSGWGILGWLVGLPLGAIVGVAVASALFGNIQQGSIGALVGMGITYMALKDIQKKVIVKKGISYYKQLVDREPNNADACVQAGLWIHENATTPQQIAEGDQFYRKALQRRPGHRDAIVMLAASLLQVKKLQEAVEFIEPWLVDRKDLMGEAIVAEALKDLGQHERAITHYRRVLEIFPETPKKLEIEQYLKQHTNLDRR